jgi:hypothetical protein
MDIRSDLRKQAPRRVRSPARLPEVTERQVQLGVLEQLKARAVPDVLWWHTPLSGRRDRIEAAGLKRLGTRAGIADLLLLHQGKLFSLELKIASGGRVTAEQLVWASDVNRCGGYSAIARGLLEAIKMLETWGLLRGVSQ